MPRTKCSVHGGTCGHVCNAYCSPETHCGEHFSALERTTKEDFKTNYEPQLQVVRFEKAVELPLPSEREDKSQFNHLPTNLPSYTHAYLVWWSGCPYPCPHSDEHATRIELLVPTVKEF